MKCHGHLLVIILSLILAGPAFSFDFEQYFIEQTMRLDYYHSGTAFKDDYSFDEVHIEAQWAGGLCNLIDTLNLGKYLFEVFDVSTNALIYSRGFASIFGEWQTTDEARKRNRTFSESVRFPCPKNKVKITISERDKQNIFQEVWSVSIDPDEANIRRTAYFADFKVKKLKHYGPPSEKVDILLLPDGYTKGQMKKFRKDAERLVGKLFATAPFSEQESAFNVWLIEAYSNESGIDNPRRNEFRDNLLSCSFNSFDSDRYVLAFDNKTIRKVASLAPYEHLYILVNSKKYGGGGIFNLYSTCVADNEWSEYIFVHEFGHSFGGLGDEYYTSDVAYSEFYPTDIEPWEPNITALLDPDNVKWRALIEHETPVPTPWNKAEFDCMNTAYRKNRRLLRTPEKKDSLTHAHDLWIDTFFSTQLYSGKVGVFEGSGYAKEGLYRPFIDCRMFTRGLAGFDPVCMRSIERVIHFYTGNQNTNQ